MKKYSPYILVATGLIVIFLGVTGKYATIYSTLLLRLGLVNELGDPTMGFSPLEVRVSNLAKGQFAPQVEVTQPSVDQPGVRFPTPTLRSLAPYPTPLPGATAEIPVDAAPTPTLYPTIPTRIEIPAISLVAPIVPSKPAEINIGSDTFEQYKAPDKFAVGWHTTSALLGQIGNTVFNGHHNIFEKVFENLNKIVPGDEIIVYGGRVRYTYTVVNVMILPERNVDMATRLENARWILPSQDERLTLITCWPAESNTHRLIVVAQPKGEPVQVTPTATSGQTGETQVHTQ
ncbi:MAG: sortase [Bellilinea sp.]